MIKVKTLRKKVPQLIELKEEPEKEEEQEDTTLYCFVNNHLLVI